MWTRGLGLFSPLRHISQRTSPGEIKKQLDLIGHDLKIAPASLFCKSVNKVVDLYLCRADDFYVRYIYLKVLPNNIPPKVQWQEDGPTPGTIFLSGQIRHFHGLGLACLSGVSDLLGSRGLSSRVHRLSAVHVTSWGQKIALVSLL